MLNCDEIKNVLVHVGLDRIGDGPLKLPFVRGLRRAFPNAQLTWFAGKENDRLCACLGTFSHK